MFDEVPDRFNLRELVKQEFDIGVEMKNHLNNS